MNEFTIWQKLPSLNEVIRTNRTNRYAGAKEKRDLQNDIGWAIRLAVREKTLHPVEHPVSITFEWWEKTKQRDLDNIASCAKFILDALVENEILKDDNVQYVVELHHILKSCNNNDYKVKVILNEVEIKK